MEHKKGYIYYLTDQTGVPRYVGKTIRTLEHRLNRHIYLNKKMTYKMCWIKSVGKENIKIVLIEECDESILSEMEIYWISEYRKLGYKLTNGTDGGDGGRLTEEVKKKISDTLTGVKHTSERIQNISNSKKGKTSPWMVGRLVSEETRKKISDTLTGRIGSNLGMKMSDESKKKMSESAIGRVVSEETRKKISDNMKTLTKTEEHKQHLKDAWIIRRQKKSVIE